MPALCLSASLAWGCGGDRSDVTEIPAEEVPPAAAAPAAQETTIVGCLRAGEAPGTFVLASLPEAMGAAADRTTRGQVATYTYMVVGEGLAQHVGQQVSVRGTIDKATDVEVAERSASERPPTRVQDDEVTPTVEVEEDALIDIRRMRASAVEPTGERCDLDG